MQCPDNETVYDFVAECVKEKWQQDVIEVQQVGVFARSSFCACVAKFGCKLTLQPALQGDFQS